MHQTRIKTIFWALDGIRVSGCRGGFPVTFPIPLPMSVLNFIPKLAGIQQKLNKMQKARQILKNRDFWQHPEWSPNPKNTETLNSQNWAAACGNPKLTLWENFAH